MPCITASFNFERQDARVFYCSSSIGHCSKLTSHPMWPCRRLNLCWACSGGRRGFVARDLTIRNTAGPAAHQAVALRVDSDRSAFFRVAVEGHQDTLYAHLLRQFYRDCRVSSTVDFVFGGLVVCVGRTCSESNDHVSGTRCLFVSADFSTVCHISRWIGCFGG